MATNFNVGKVALNPRGLWSNSVVYNKFDLVKNEHQSSYVAIKDNVPAGTLLTNETYWYDMANFDGLAENIQQVANNAIQVANDKATVLETKTDAIAARDAAKISETKAKESEQNILDNLGEAILLFEDVGNLGDEKLTAITTAGTTQIENINNAGSVKLSEINASGAVLYSPQTLTDVQKEQTRTNINAASKTDLNTLLSYTIKKYSVRFSGSAAAGVREDNAVGMVAGVAVGNAIAVNDFDRVSFFDRPICCCTFDATANKWRVNAYKGEPGFAWDGSAGEVMYECTPCAHSDNTDLNTYVSVTGTPCEGYTLFECFKDWHTKLYLPVFNLAMYNNVATSRAGLFPTYDSLNGAMTKARTFHAKAHTETMEVFFYETCLQYVEFATKDQQTVMMGACYLSYNSTTTQITSVVSSTVFKMLAVQASDFVAGQSVAIGSAQNGEQRTSNVKITSIEADTDVTYSIVTLAAEVANLVVGDYLSSRMYITGAAATAVTNASSGSPVSNISGKYPCIWRGKENPWANGFSYICNVLVQRYGEGTTENPYSYKLFYLPEPNKYNNGTITADYIETNFFIATADGYGKTVGHDTRYPFIICTTELGGASTTYIAAYYSYPRYVVCVVRVGGGFYDGLYGGLYFGCYYAPSGSSVRCAARLLCNP